MKNLFNNKFFVVIIIIIFFLLGFMLNFAVTGGSMPPRQVIGIVVTPIQGFFKNIGNTVNVFFDSISEYDSLKAQNEELSKALLEMQARLEGSAVLEAENNRLKGLLEIKEIHPDYSFIQADVVSLSTAGYVSRFQINKGSADGVSESDTVVSANGLVGYVSSVGYNYSDVITLIDPMFSVGARIVSTGESAMTEGSVDYSSDNLVKLVYIPKNSNIKRGDLIQTSGLNGTYPSGINIGTVSSIKVQSNGLSLYAVITPTVDFANLTSVYIITGFESDSE